MTKKNQDYAEADDPYRNFRRHGLTGMLVRLDDKISRLQSFIQHGGFAVDESLQDTILDIINYAVLFAGFVADADEAANQTPATNQTPAAHYPSGPPPAKTYSFQDYPDEAVPIQRALFEKLG